MPTFVRRNALVISGTFTAKDGSTTQPTSASAALYYTNTSGAKITAKINLSYDSGVWSGVWDSTDCKEGRVDWVVSGVGTLIAATEGSFEVQANKANT